ncbi:hypothetical protein os1_22930 [Comamonadaceae bacterium OS-1]|nr:hypothetical protein os1_22930 [Comamonadaceae bacterium OS-1]
MKIAVKNLMNPQREQPGTGAVPGIILVLAHASDAGAASVAASVRNLLAGAPVEVWTVRPESLGLAAWSHTVDAHGCAHTRLVLPGRPALHSNQIRAVFNRIQHLPMPQFSQAPPKDRDYAAMELQALVLSWLAACGGCVVQPLRGQPWLTPQLPLLHWASAAARCGLPVADQSAVAAPAPWDATVLVAGPLSTGILAGRLGVACVATAQNLGFTLLEFRFQRDSEGATLVDVSPHPELSDLEDIDAVARCLADLAERALVEELA